MKVSWLNKSQFQRDSNFISTSSRDQVLLMYRAAQKNKTKAGQMLVGKGRKENLNYYPGMLNSAFTDQSSDTVITDYEVCKPLYCQRTVNIKVILNFAFIFHHCWK